MISQLPDFLGGTCSCPNPDGCLRSDKGPWNDPELMKVWSLSVEMIFRILCNNPLPDISHFSCQKLCSWSMHYMVKHFIPEELQASPIVISKSNQFLHRYCLSCTMFFLSSYLRDALCLRPLFSVQLLRNEIGTAEPEVEMGASAYRIIQSKQLSDKVSNKSLCAPFMVYQLLTYAYAKLRTHLHLSYLNFLSHFIIICYIHW